MPDQPLGTGRRYLFLFGLQTIGALIILSYALPLYRAVVADPAGHRPSIGPVIWASAGAALIQVGFWIRHRLRPSLPQSRNALIGYLMLFLSRMSFLIGTAIFVLVFIAQRPELNLPTSRYFLTLAGLFSLFCYTQEVETFTKRLIEPRQKPAK